MFMKLLILGLSLLVLSRESQGITYKEGRRLNSNAFDTEAGSGDHSTALVTDDEDLTEFGSGDGSGSGSSGDVTTSAPHTTKSLTPCEQLRLSAQNVSKDIYPKCTDTGEFQRVQCHINLKECWCVDKTGTEITGSRMRQPKMPDCMTGSGLKPCVFQLLRSKYQTMLGKFEPRCTFEGDFEKIQCFGSACWCVDEEGIEQWNTKVYKPAVPSCKEITPKPIPETKAPETEAPVRVTELPYIPIDKTKVPHHHDHKPDRNKPFIPIDEEDDTKDDKNDDVIDKVDPGREDNTPDDDNNSDDIDTQVNGPAGQKSSKDPIVYIMSQPGLLAAVIGGAVVGLLCAILLVMFIVYRMRKKDEGSYPLEEQKYTNYSYMKAPDKEFYA
ncbi:hypothetical protein FSP39_022100 [Pinctada imbricata]|uniref:Syndecan n=1 Tax=Pinctada imbricata TaxID=66713 RepID=A0AA88XTZ2_PINIB|nr:hypothetical protein FSP39_022100 [Pinctada imbricata]